MPCEPCEGTGQVEIDTFESITQQITRLLQWIGYAEAELTECTKHGRTLEFELKQGYSSSFSCHYIGPKNAVFDDSKRLSKYWIRVVKANIKDARNQVQAAKLKLIEVL
jgi:hypothetical protein